MPSDKGLHGINVLVTRPKHQAATLCELIASHGGTAVQFPVLEIIAPHDTSPIQELANRLACFDMAIFISPNAVDWGVKWVREFAAWPQALRVAAVGLGTARRLAEYGIDTKIFPTSVYNSEALLALPELQSVANLQIVIFRGEGGRETLAQTLRHRGAVVEYAECYRRARPPTDVSLLRTWLEQPGRHIISVTSNESLQNLYDMVPAQLRDTVRKLPLLTVSERSLPLVHELGFSQIILADQASDQALVSALLGWNTNSAV